MALIISSQASADFAAEGVSPVSVTSALSTIGSATTQIQVIAETPPPVSPTIPSAPSGMPTAATTLFNTTRTSQQAALNQAKGLSLHLTIFIQVWALINLTKNAPRSRQDIIDQLTATFTASGDTVSLAFLTDALASV